MGTSSRSPSCETTAKPLDVAHVIDTVKRLGETGRLLRKQAGTMEPDLTAS
jgi:hypothetical protein